MPIGTSDGKVFEDEWAYATHELQVWNGPMQDKSNNAEMLLDPILPEERYNDTPTSEQRHRDEARFNKGMLADSEMVIDPEKNQTEDNMLEKFPDAQMRNYLSREGEPGSQIIRQNVSYQDPENRPRITVTPNAPVVPKTEGNIDLNNRPKVQTPEGTATVRSLGVNIDGQETLIPTVAHDGSRILSNDEAIQQYKDSGQHLGIFNNQDEADKYAQQLHLDQQQQYVKPIMPNKNTPSLDAIKQHPDYTATVNKLTNNFDTYKTFGRVLGRIGTGLVNLAAFPGKVMKGDVDIQSPEGREQSAKWASEMALTMVMTPAPLVGKAVDGTLGSIAGVSAKNFPKRDNVLARMMEDRGFDHDQIWQATKTYRGADGKWRFELPSEEAALKQVNPKNFVGALPDVLEFPSLYEAYPKLRNVGFKIDNDLNSLGTYLADKNQIVLNLDLIKKHNMNTKEVILHEVQHKIQEVEGFPSGTNSIWEYRNFIDKMYETADKSGKFGDLMEASRLELRANKVSNKIGDKLYLAEEGEREARIVEMRNRASQDFKSKVSPAKQQEMLDAQAARQKELRQNIKEFGTTGEGKPEGWTQQLIDKSSASMPPSDNVTRLLRPANDNKILTGDTLVKGIDEWRRIAQEEGHTSSFGGKPNPYIAAREYSKIHGQATVIGSAGNKAIYVDGKKVIRERIYDK